MVEWRDKAERLQERVRYLEGATNHAGGTPLSLALRELEEMVKAYEGLRGLICDHIGHWGICDSADDDGESLVCGSDLCSYCALVLAVDGRGRNDQG
jgi:hypothetical protein